MTDRLPWDCCRCEGRGCGRRESCLRFVELRNMGPRTPVAQRLCDGWREAYIKMEAKE